MSQSKISVAHVRLKAGKSFDEFILAFEGQLGHFDEDVY